ncbi:cytochrome C biogenesis protein [Candidatus Thiomargarita nelsonii]|uniref:Cytochrome C biogenesis protein n=1 Tax=Candidatus Thiomargarita nelsonii TaxID=1003181 RepID=A0A0A6PB18_9GAMM|nr:cytochrome C biogenesis protein [Candidatus Thiomargarita nelsonii]
MIPELGQFALILALCLALAQTIFPLIGTALTIPNWMAVARPAAVGQLVFMSLAFACLTYAFINNDFSVLYVASHSNTALPLAYRIASVWGGHEGSLLLWSLLLSLWTVAVVIFSRSLPQNMAARVIAVMGFVSIGFLLFMLFTSNPFDRLSPAPLNGQDLNPLLQDPGLVIHPPMLYMGYVGFSVAFSFAIAALLGGTLDSAWARWSRPWTLVAWIFLTFGIVLGSWWAYYELGWGGWWFWDPVENASFMPWLVGTALLHSLAVTEKRSAFKNWTVLLAILAFSLSLLGTFLVRSGVLTSVHAFATDPERGVFILAFLGIVIGLSLVLYAWRAPTVGKGGHFEPMSKETLLLLNNILLVVACGGVLLGTLYPLFIDALGMGKISVGPPYFSVVFFWIMAPLMFLLGIGPMAGWKNEQVKNLVIRLRYTFIASIALAVILPVLVMGKAGLIVFPGMAAAVWIVLTSLQNVRDKMSKRSLGHLPRSFYGMTTAHIGVAVFVVGVTLSSAFSVEKDVRLAPQTPLELGGYSFIFEGTQSVNGPNYKAEQGLIKVLKNGEQIAVLEPQKRYYRVQKMPMTEAAIDWGFTRDIYVALGEPLDNGAWSVRVYYKPFIRWIWLGGLLMVLGGLLAATDKRYRRTT